jgi:hypothetical protein
MSRGIRRAVAGGSLAALACMACADPATPVATLSGCWIDRRTDGSAPGDRCG